MALTESEPLINVRKLAALDIVFHGPKLILVEFALSTFLLRAFGAAAWLAYLSHPILFIGIVGCVLLGIGFNYMPLLLHAISIVCRKNAHQEAAFEPEHPSKYNRMYHTTTTSRPSNSPTRLTLSANLP